MPRQAGKKLEKKVSDSERAFIDEYIRNGYNATRAYLKIHPKVKYESARVLASTLLTKVNIREAIAEEFKKLAMDRDEVLARLASQARASHYHFIEFDEDGSVYFDFSSEEAKSYLHLIKKIKTKRNRRILGKGDEAESWESEWVEVELHDSQAALKLIGDNLKLWKPEEGDGDKFTAPQVVEIIKHYEEKRDK